MSRLGVLYALKDEELNILRSLPQDERYDYMLEEIEESLLDTPRGCELDKAWEGIQYCLGAGAWKQENSVPTNIIFGGEFLVETGDEIITLKNHSDVIQIVDYLHHNNLKDIIRKNFHLIEEQEYSLSKIELMGIYEETMYWAIRLFSDVLPAETHDAAIRLVANSDNTEIVSHTKRLLTQCKKGGKR